MALSDYTGLVASLSTWLNGSPFSGSEDDFISLATAELNARLAIALAQGNDIRPMITRNEVIITGEYVALPDASGSMILPLSLEIPDLDQPWKIEYVSSDSLARQKYSVELQRGEVTLEISGNPPRYYSIVGDQFRFFPAPIDGDSFGAEFIRYTAVPTLTADAPTNWVLTNHPNAYLYGALAQAELFGWNDSRMANLATLFANAVDGIASRYPVPSDQTPLRSEVAYLGNTGRGFSATTFANGTF